jgi:RNA polymerase sigma factor (sigma-70 family)
MSDTEIINLIKKGKHSKALSRLYKIYPAVRKYVIETGGSATESEDIFQDALLIFMDKVYDQNFQLSASISTYIFGICKNLCREKIRKNNRTTHIEQEINDDEFEKNIEEFLEEERKYQALDQILIEAGKKCMDILKMFYYENLSMKVIATKLGFSSETSAKTQKYKCLEKARDLTNTILMEYNTTQL